MALRRSAIGTGDQSDHQIIRHIYRAVPVHHVSSSFPSKLQQDKERKVRRQIANSNERRRMQSINNGFDALRNIIKIGESEKFISKSALLQSTIEYIERIVSERDQLLAEVKQLKQYIRNNLQSVPDVVPPVSFTEDDSVVDADKDDDNNLDGPSSSVVIADGRIDYPSESADQLSSPGSVLCSSVHPDASRTETADHSKKSIQFGFEDRLCCDPSWSSLSASNEAFRGRLRPHLSGLSKPLSNDSSIHPQENDINAYIDSHEVQNETSGRSNLEIILTAIQHIEKSGHETLPSGTNIVGPSDSNVVEFKTDSSSNQDDCASSSISVSAVRGKAVTTFVQGSKNGGAIITKSDVQQPPSLAQRIPTLLLHRVNDGNTSAARVSTTQTNISRQASNIIVLNNPTVTLTSPDGGEMQYHLAAVTK